MDVYPIKQAIEPLLAENRLINEFVDSLKQNISFDDGINIAHLLAYFDFTPEAKVKINKKLFQEKVIDTYGQEHSVASLIDESRIPIEYAVIKQMHHGAKESSIEKLLTNIPELVIGNILPHLESHDLVEIFKALHLNNQTNPHNSTNDRAATESPVLHEGSEENDITGGLRECCCVVS